MAQMLIFSINIVGSHFVSDGVIINTKDHIEKIDFQELIFAVIYWPDSELYGHLSV